jgi:hypothetical protein
MDDDRPTLPVHDPRVHHNLHRSELAFQMLCAFNNIKPEQAPAEFMAFHNPYMADAWRRVAEAATRYVSAAVSAASVSAADASAWKDGGRDRDRTCDPYDVNVEPCANNR